MKNFTLLIIATLISFMPSSAFATDIKDVEMFGYARAGVGTNTRGGDQECFYNQGAGGGSGIGRNEFRLGNECSNYLEVGLKFNHIKSDKKKAFTQLRVSNSHNGHEQTESASQSTNFVEAFAQIEGMNDLPWSFWVGKKFYRDQDVYIDDYYYFGSLNGNGAGIGNIDIGNSKLSLAYLRQVGATKTNIGTEGLTIFDARFKEIQLTDSIKQNVWLAYGQSPESYDITTGDKYVKSTGFIVGSLIEFNLGENGFNHTALIFGQGVMNEFNLYGDSTVTVNNTHKDTQRLRFVNHTTYNLSTKWAYHLAASAEHQQIKNQTGSQWFSLGVRPLYRVTDTFHLTAEVGHSVVKDLEARQLTRLTFAPQLSVSENIWGRPVLRAFYTRSYWNNANKKQVAGKAPTYANANSGGSYGFQMESFF